MKEIPFISTSYVDIIIYIEFDKIYKNDIIINEFIYINTFYESKTRKLFAGNIVLFGPNKKFIAYSGLVYLFTPLLKHLIDNKKKITFNEIDIYFE